jgi:NAD(P)-dependent dehydrogenase (short-subunit alcohol dehydrogenase family)
MGGLFGIQGGAESAHAQRRVRASGAWYSGNAVSPAGVVTPGSSHGKRRVVTEPARTRPAPLGQLMPADIAGTVAYLLSPAAAKVTGQSLIVDSGWLLT